MFAARILGFHRGIASLPRQVFSRFHYRSPKNTTRRYFRESSGSPALATETKGGNRWATSVASASAASTIVALSLIDRDDAYGPNHRVSHLEQPKNIRDVYDISGEILGEGGFGVVYRAKRKLDGAPVALKAVDLAETDVAEFDREIAALTTLSDPGHPNICKLFGTHRGTEGTSSAQQEQQGKYSDQNMSYVAMEIIEGGELLEHLCTSGPYSEANAAKFVRELAEAMTYMHGMRIAHADLKCENLMLSSWEDEKASLKVVDFGCSVTTDRFGVGSGADGFRGTPAYCSPDRLRDKKGLPTLASDMFAIGIIVYILLTGSHPFDPMGDLSDEQLERVITMITPDKAGEVRLNSMIMDDRVAGLSQSSKALIEALMHPDTSKRMKAEDLVNHPWVQGLEASWRKMQGSDRKLQKYWQRSFRAIIMRSYGAKVASDDNMSSGTLSDANLMHIFHSIDLDGNGYLSPTELRLALRHLGIEEENIAPMIGSVDIDQNGEVSFEEFKIVLRQSFRDGPGVRIEEKKRFRGAVLAALGNVNGADKESNERRLRRVFQLIDKDGNGTLSHDELSSFLLSFGVLQGNIASLIEEIDLDGSGGVDWDEFRKVMDKVEG